jgi:phosphoribosylglycinamide formyltransferase-1
MNTGAARLPIVVLASGKGSNLKAIAERAAAGSLPVEIRAVVSDRPGCGAIEWSAARGLSTAVVEPRNFADRVAYDLALADVVERCAPGLVVLAGFMRILDASFVDRFAGRMLNIHPSLLPRHRGLHTHRRVLEAGEPEHGASVHFVTRELDGGPVVLQAVVPVKPDDDESTLAARVLEQEHRIYGQCIAWYAAGRLGCHDGAAWLDGRRLEAPIRLDAQDGNEKIVAA